MLHVNDIYAYLIILNHQPVLKTLTEQQLKAGRENMSGCLVRLKEDIEPESYLLIAIKNREQLNGIHTVGQSDLQYATEEVACLLQAYLIAEKSIRRPETTSSCKGAE